MLDHSSQPDTIQSFQPVPLVQQTKDWGVVWIVLALGIGLPLTLYGLLPAVGVEGPSNWFSLKKIGLLVGLLVGGFGYWTYLKAILKRPQWLVCFMLVGWIVLEGINGQLLTMGINLRERPMLLLMLGVPLSFLGWRYRKALVEYTPHLKGLLVFFTLVLVYFLFYNAKAADPKVGMDALWSEGSISFTQLTSYLFIIFGVLGAGVSMIQSRKPDRLFDHFNMVLMLGTSIVAFLPIVGFPFGQFCQIVDGFMRANGLFSHPNPYSHHMGLLMVYLLGLLCYYQGQNNDRVPKWLLFTALGVNAVAFLLGLSKTAMGTFAGCAALVLALNMATPGLRKNVGKILVASAVLVPIGLIAFQVVTGKGLLDIMEARGEQNTSLLWRTEIWNSLLSSLSPESMALGHGFTAANMLVYQLTYNSLTNATPLILVHNGYLSLLYDFGLIGLLLFVVLLWTMWWAIRRLSWASLGPVRPLLVTLVAMGVYFLSASSFDEMIYMFDAPMLFWMLATLIVFRVHACSQGADQQNPLSTVTSLTAH
jgi:O-antigen ligase